ncbi:Crp/Fnr family transcriptional regulator [Altererythrobacter sp. B11]|uniref:Crp/Fnr family transcriptional regulator n=1 Tax=Altererythrobacter sp. B11 TaxID=2060312 RepID=UPI000DC6D533|nr:Crp/Fnr family transcriptional regulator [Altererythrobacter sp. B11]BBC71533.1 Crp/Fnr family transcriptional regulator [Altererythrobacter sp. B11]
MAEIHGSDLLGALHPPDMDLLSRSLESVDFKTGHILYEPGDDVRFAYFPRGSAITTFHVLMADGAAVQTALVGSEGAVGGIVSHGGVPAFARSCVMHGGSFYRISVQNLEEVARESIRLRYLLSRYADCLLAQIFQSVACNAVHTIEQRAAKWLVAAMNRTGRSEIAMTQDQLASLLGVGRTYISRVVQRMKAEGLITTRRGAILIDEPEKLRRKSCHCDHLVALHFETVLKGVYSETANGNGK